MSYGLSDRGEELLFSESFVGQTFEVTVYDETTDDVSDDADMSAVTSEPDVTRGTHTIVDGDVGQFDGDYGVTFTADVEVRSTTVEVDSVLLIESGTTNIVARCPIDQPQPGPKQWLGGLDVLRVEPQITTD